MRRERTFRPSLQPLEGRVVLSLSFSKMFHSVFGIVENHKANPKAHHSLALSSTPQPAGHVPAGHHPRAHPHTKHHNFLKIHFPTQL